MRNLQVYCCLGLGIQGFEEIAKPLQFN